VTQEDPPLRPVPFEFRATGAEYFRIWIVNLLLSIVTLGIYSAWAKVRRLRYFHGSTYLDGHAFDYNAEPKAILIGRLITVGAYGVFLLAGKINPLLNLIVVPLLVVGLPWVVMRSRRFHLRMTSWRGLRFAFHGDYRGAFKAYILWWLASTLTLGALFPYYLRNTLGYQFNNAAYGSQRAAFNTGIKPFYRFFGLFLLRSLVVIVLAVVLAGLIAGVLSTVFPKDAFTVIAVLPFVLVAVIMAGCYQAALLNLMFNTLTIGPHRLQSNLRITSLVLLMLSNAALIVLTLGLYTPWAKVRLLRYQFDHLQVLAASDLGEFSAAATPDDSQALGDEISDFFDVDFAI